MMASQRRDVALKGFLIPQSAVLEINFVGHELIQHLIGTHLHKFRDFVAAIG
jgi:hypothetical protein